MKRYGTISIKLFQSFECKACGHRARICAMDHVMFIGVKCQSCGQRMANVTPRPRRATREVLQYLDRFRQMA